MGRDQKYETEKMIRQINETRKPRAARCLFGPVDKNKIDEMLDQNLAQLQADKKAEIKAKFNFDVDEEQPIESSLFKWEKVTTAPSFYKCTSGRRKTRDKLNKVEFEETKDFEATGKANDKPVEPAASTVTPSIRKAEKVVTLKSKLSVRSSNIAGQKRKATMPAREAQTQPTLQLTSVRRGAKQSKLSTRCMR